MKLSEEIMHDCPCSYPEECFAKNKCALYEKCLYRKYLPKVEALEKVIEELKKSINIICNQCPAAENCPYEDGCQLNFIEKNKE